jgi:hypothetical protein
VFRPARGTICVLSTQTHFLHPHHTFLWEWEGLGACIPQKLPDRPRKWFMSRAPNSRRGTFLWDWPCKKFFSSFKKKCDHHMTIMMVTPYILLEKWWSCDGHADGHTFKLEKFFMIFYKGNALLKNYFSCLKKVWPSWWSCDGHA